MGDRYTITERVDQGGMAEVFRGVAESMQGFKKSVAIKRILPSLTKNKKFVSMFLDEARLSLHLQHANVVQVFDIGVGADTAYFIVMEYVDGANLKGVLDYNRKLGRRLRISQSLYIMNEVCKGLAYAHDAVDPMTGSPLGIVHRDISPPNILLSRQGEVKLVDFGLAKATSQLESTDPGVVKGKFSYLSPEAASGREVDNRADIFAVGILLWELLTGQRLFFGESDYQTVELVRQARIPPLRPLNPEVPPDLEAVVMKALARDPAERFQHAADLGDAIAQVQFGHNLKVTSREIANMIKQVVADRTRSKPRDSRNLITALIGEEMAKFTSLDELGKDALVDASEPSPVPVGSGQSPLDPGLFVDPRGWADDVSSPVRNTAALAAQAGDRAPASGGPGGAPRAGQGPRPGQPGAEVPSLQQMLEPDRTGIEERIEPPASNRATLILLALAVLLAVLIGGGAYLFRDRIFGSSSEAPAPAQRT